ncbi:hypothetical protein Ahy_B02g061033 isoform C [Arachis hypogaea]|uniref:TIR domain-containing protein n=1 Tax=Arachis hypogaea TaxID=3818 RepID=A0A445AJT8_ARAHY|nr:hypothetical protein Ahy_B02g061033 isoform C [Arachis hypogaea]
MQQRPYDVFLSFRGKETRSKFISHLYASLENAGIYVFKDENGLARGENLSISLLKAIGESKTYIIILSPNYAFSRWCLQELEDIMIFCKNKTQKVLPVFYHIDPSEVRNQTGKFGQAFDNLMRRYPDKIRGKEQSWRKALREVGCIAGLVIRKSKNSQGLSSIIRGLPQVQNVGLECGSQLQIADVASDDTFKVTNCNEMIVTSSASNVSKRSTSSLAGCCSKHDIIEDEISLNLILIQMGMSCSVTEKFSPRVPGDCLLPGNKNPDWLAYSSEDSSVTFHVPQVNGRRLKTVLLCIVYSSSPKNVPSEAHIVKNLFIINHTKTTPYVYDGDTLASLKDEEWQKVTSNLEAGDKVQIVVVAGLGFTVKKIAVYLVYADQQAEGIVCADDMVAYANFTVHGGDNNVSANCLSIYEHYFKV